MGESADNRKRILIYRLVLLVNVICIIISMFFRWTGFLGVKSLPGTAIYDRNNLTCILILVCFIIATGFQNGKRIYFVLVQCACIGIFLRLEYILFERGDGMHLATPALFTGVALTVLLMGLCAAGYFYIRKNIVQKQ